MKYIATLLTTLVLFYMSAAQTKSIIGEYYLQGVMETASGFKLNTDSTFEFFFSYGALDRYGSGKWRMQDDKIILNSKPYPGKDYKLVKSIKTNDPVVKVQIEDQNTNLYSLMYCLLRRKEGDTIINADDDGIIDLPVNHIDTIYLLSQLCPERISAFPVNTEQNNFFTFHLEQWIVEVFFKDFELKLVKDHLEGTHPLLEPKTYQYIKE